VKTGVQRIFKFLKKLDSGFRRNDGKPHFLIFYEFIKRRGFEVLPLEFLTGFKTYSAFSAFSAVKSLILAFRIFDRS